MNKTKVYCLNKSTLHKEMSFSWRVDTMRQRCRRRRQRRRLQSRVLASIRTPFSTFKRNRSEGCKHGRKKNKTAKSSFIWILCQEVYSMQMSLWGSRPPSAWRGQKWMATEFEIQTRSIEISEGRMFFFFFLKWRIAQKLAGRSLEFMTSGSTMTRFLYAGPRLLIPKINRRASWSFTLLAGHCLEQCFVGETSSCPDTRLSWTANEVCFCL